MQTGSNSQTERIQLNEGNTMSKKNRKPVFAGQFYPLHKEELNQQLDLYFKQADKIDVKNIRAVIAPHAGYVFSGQVAASGYKQLDTTKQYRNVFILASSHRYAFGGVSIYSKGNYVTPLGEVETNMEIVDSLLDYDIIYSKDEIHEEEHSLEVQLPFLQKIYGENLRIVPLVIGASDASVSKRLAEILQPYFTEENLFVISTDFSHYPGYTDAVNVDELTAKTILKNKPSELQKLLRDHKKMNMPGLATGMCGWSSVLTLLYLSSVNERYTYDLVEYRNSGDISGDKTRVVGYWSIVLTETTHPSSEFKLSESSKKQLLNLARKTIEMYLDKGEKVVPDPGTLSDEIIIKCGAFVTLHKNGKLRGCIGRFTADEPLYSIVQEMAIAAATKDSRFPTLKMDDMEDVEIEISVLSPMKKIETSDDIELGKHGIYIKKGFNTGTFLPQVAAETDWSKEEFLGHCSRDKAGLGWEGWKTAEMYIYTATIFAEND